MPNVFKYTTGAAPASTLKKGNFYIGNNVADYGTTFYTGISPASGGYTIYLNKASGGPSIYVAANDSQLISFTNHIAGTNYTTINQCFNYYYTQTDKICVTQNYPTDFPFIVLDGLIFYIDAGINISYPGNGTTWTDINGLGPKNNGTLINGPTFNSANGGSIVFDGVDDYAEITQQNTNLEFQPTQPYSAFVWLKGPQAQTGAIIANMDGFSGGYPGWDIIFQSGNAIAMHLISQWSTNAIKIWVTYNYSTYLNQWIHFGYTYDGSSPTTSAASLNSVNFYLNGVLYSTGKAIADGGDGFNSSSQTITYNNNQRFRVGSRWKPGTADIPAAVTISNVTLYNKALSSSEILQNYNAQKSRFGL